MALTEQFYTSDEIRPQYRLSCESHIAEASAD